MLLVTPQRECRCTPYQIRNYMSRVSGPLLDRIDIQAMAQHAFSARSYTRILKVARTIADLAGEDRVRLEHVSEAIRYRSAERHFWR